LYVTNSNIQAIRIAAMFVDDVPNELLFPECCCGTDIDQADLCMNPLDREFPLPGYLMKQTLQLASQTLLGTYFSLKSDNTADGLDGQSPEVNRKSSRR